ncbi:hypothetical protein ACRE_042340 [Hapsidospora chrysogenum ATCC 11550]|uniref:Uncharacterized protein n=1 Tax=Hapsidospora chrysogenum (strain ATCC 11550 / CBS 779.69 / DSM 880 / IAM 14645 / JCM 23072 / IMI 49137) TaxID=857340 RepID=A0A086T6F6_HAPC1|nr:hypothetical protein ACRE_042340 [Hapsidospora chrysogenum ATCC 11550]
MELVLPLLLLSAAALYAATNIITAKQASRRNRHQKDEAMRRLHDDTAQHTTSGDLQRYKSLYYKLHNPEQNTDVLPEAKALLLFLLSETLQTEGPTKGSAILGLEIFSRGSLDRFVQQELDAVTREWDGYLGRRKAGGPPELLPTGDDAKAWLVEIAPLKLVDGAWLGQVHRITTTPFALRLVTKAAWQVLSEELVAKIRGPAAVQGEWKRVQAGYILSKNIGRRRQPRDVLGEKVLEIFQAKSVACNRIHDHCPMRLRGRSRGTWLNPRSFSRITGLAGGLPAVPRARPPLDPFTDREVATIRDWIDSLAPSGPDTYTRFAGRPDMRQEVSHADAEVRGKNNLMTRPDILGRVSVDGISSTSESTGVTGPLAVDIRTLNIHKLLPIWFAHASLLESMVSVPWTVANPTGCAIVKLLRAQCGFPPEPMGVYGVDEIPRADTVDLVSIGLELISAADPGMTPLPSYMAAVPAHWPSRFAQDMLAAATRPRKLQWQLLGMTCAFVQLHGVLVASSSSPLSEQTRTALDVMRRREEESLARDVYWQLEK